MALFTYHLSGVSNLHLILGNLLDLMWVHGLGHQVLGLGYQNQVLGLECQVLGLGLKSLSTSLTSVYPNSKQVTLCLGKWVHDEDDKDNGRKGRLTRPNRISWPTQELRCSRNCDKTLYSYVWSGGKLSYSSVLAYV